jgi:hypothetical protein
VLCQMAERCSGVCALLLHAITEMIAPEDRERTQAVLLAGGRGSRSLLRLAGASADYEDFTFNLDCYTSKSGTSLFNRKDIIHIVANLSQVTHGQKPYFAKVEVFRNLLLT